MPQRVYEDDLSRTGTAAAGDAAAGAGASAAASMAAAAAPAPAAKEKTLEERQAEVVPKFTAAVQLGLRTLDVAFTVYVEEPAPLHDDSDGEA
jgi:hypothetical protein